VRILAIISSTLSWVINFLRYTCFLKQHSISYAGIVVLFLSILFRGVSFLLLTAVLVYYVFGPISVTALASLQLVLASFFVDEILKQIISPAFNLNQYSFLRCIPKKVFTKLNLNQEILYKDTLYKFNLAKFLWLFYFNAAKFIIYFKILIEAYFTLEIGPTFIFLLIGFGSEVLSHIFRLFYFKLCHVWKDILPVKESQKIKLKIFDPKFEIIPENEKSILKFFNIKRIRIA
jgi:hypothetical protein